MQGYMIIRFGLRSLLMHRLHFIFIIVIAENPVSQSCAVGYDGITDTGALVTSGYLVLT
jgi:hypothetical protein